MAVSSNEEMQN